VSTLIFRASGAQVAVVMPDSTVAMRRVSIGRDFGTEVEVLEGVDAGSRVILSPPDSLVEKQPVRVVQAAAEAPKGQER
jgi:hypothetical protein